MLRTTWHNDIATPIPSDVSPEKVTNILHNHGFLITLSPIVTRYEESSREGDKVTYTVWENIDFLPFGLWKHEIQFTCTFENTRDGLVSWIQAPLNLTSQATYSVKAADGAGPGNGSWFLDEGVDSECSVFLRAFVEKTLVATRKKMHLTIMEKARSGEI